MQTLLMVVTGLSLAVAVLMSLVVLRMLREERRRSEARVAALLAAAGGEGMSAARDRSHVTPGARAARDHDLPLRPAAAALFAEPERQPAWGGRIAVAAGLLAVLLGIGLTMLTAGDGDGKGSAGASAAPAPLELLTLRHAAEAGSLTVSGIVQNPRDGVLLRRVVATAFALAADGSILATGQAPLDLVVFGPGEESPFVVAMPVSGPVARYRIGFRSEAGGVIAHVDRRTAAEAVAQK